MLSWLRRHRVKLQTKYLSSWQSNRCMNGTFKARTHRVYDTTDATNSFVLSLPKDTNLRLFCNFRAIFIGRWLTTVWAYDDRRGAHIVCAIYLWAIDEQSVFKNTSSFAVVCAAAKSTNWLQTRQRKRLRERESKQRKAHSFDSAIKLCGACSSSLLICASPFLHFPLFSCLALTNWNSPHMFRAFVDEKMSRMRKLKVWLNEIRDEKRAAREYAERKRVSPIDLIFTPFCERHTFSIVFQTDFSVQFEFSDPLSRIAE